MKPQKHIRLEVVALESRELLSTLMPAIATNDATAAADVLRVGPTEGMASVSGSISGWNLYPLPFSVPCSPNMELGGSGCNITNDTNTRSDDNFAQRLLLRPDIPFVVIPTIATQPTQALGVPQPITITQRINETHTMSDENFAKRLQLRPDIPFVVIPTVETQPTQTPMVSRPRRLTHDTHSRSHEHFAKRLKHKPDIPFVVIPTVEIQTTVV
jgi:hypothetical protein